MQNTGNRAENNTQFLVNLWMEKYKQEVGGGGVRLPPSREVFLSFFQDDYTLAPEIFSSCSFIPCVHFETS